jgi:nucleoside-diphosphate kinase
MKEAAFVILKPDGVVKNLFGPVVTRFSETGLDLVALRVVSVARETAESHYRHIKDSPFFEGVIDYLMGKFHGQNKIVLLVYRGDQAIKKCRDMAGATNPEKARPTTIRGAFGRITTQGVFENVVHVSSDPKDAEREIKLWLDPVDFWEPAAPSLSPSEKKPK